MCCGLGIVCNLHKVFRNNIQWASLDSEETWIRFQQEVSSGKRSEENKGGNVADSPHSNSISQSPLDGITRELNISQL